MYVYKTVDELINGEIPELNKFLDKQVEFWVRFAQNRITNQELELAINFPVTDPDGVARKQAAKLLLEARKDRRIYDPDGDADQFLNGDPESTFKTILAEGNFRQLQATGRTPGDYIYNHADSVRKSDIDGYVYVTFRSIEYGPTYKSWGALDGDKNKFTVLIQANDGKWYKLWFWNKE